ncbi:hypothetical protein F4054_23780 [Candidatus Poribacteria bacterium]|nr:hypothetical protein [Candidatus Poribacteria bacterium]MYK25274.1 hypothetical protein [Candidatus Poribacteria bacterium]
MSRIYDFFLDIKNNPMDYVGRSSNSDFEKQVIDRLETFGYHETNFNELGNSYRTYWRKLIESDDGIIENTTPFKQNYIFQPFGTQSYPDVLILDNKTVLCLEVKSSKGTKPVWNSGLPKANGLYIFGSYVKKDITFFRGCDILNDEDRKRLSGFFENAMKNAESFNQEYMSNQEFGFGVYARKMYQNQQTHNPEAIINFFQNHRRYDLERQVLEYCKGLQRSD